MELGTWVLPGRVVISCAACLQAASSKISGVQSTVCPAIRPLGVAVTADRDLSP
ncbi:hypothetical protein ACFW08_15155 [Streptomyces sp. NPDC058960]|uniref:hypothetical protein n=1 Tax=Streptomyces sp. NPDC058960 TaxID=3346679 RepID=UPI0036C945F4